jgi:hypothetical protein
MIIFHLHQKLDQLIESQPRFHDLAASKLRLQPTQFIFKLGHANQALVITDLLQSSTLPK